jgi:GT2 family glycosyltransferase
VRKDRPNIPLTLSPDGAEAPEAEAAAYRYPSPRSYDVVLVAQAGEAASPEIDRLARRFAAEGHRVFKVRSSSDGGRGPAISEDSEGVFDVALPVSSDAPERDETWATVRRDYHMVDAVCFVESSATRPISQALCDNLGWRMVYGLRAAATATPVDPDQLSPADRRVAEASDLLIASTNPPDGAWRAGKPKRLVLPSGAGALDRYWGDLKAAILSLYPRVSVVVVTYNKLELNRLCLQSLFDRTTYPNYEVVVVDNGSTDGTREYLTEFAATHPECKVVFNDANDGYSPANNRGVAASTGDYVVLLNNDTVLTRGWLSRLVRPLRDPRVGLVGPVSSWPGNESGIETDYRTLADMETFAETYTRARESQWYDAIRVIFFCVAMRRSVWDEVGPLDERFALGVGFEDDDYNERVKQKGYRLVYVEDAIVHHWGVATNSKRDVKDHWKLLEKNRRLFESKWGRWDPYRHGKSKRGQPTGLELFVAENGAGGHRG